MSYSIDIKIINGVGAFSLGLWVEYHENDFRGIEAMEIIFKTIKQLFMRGYCKHFPNQKAIDAQNVFKTFILGQ